MQRKKKKKIRVHATCLEQSLAQSTHYINFCYYYVELKYASLRFLPISSGTDIWGKIEQGYFSHVILPQMFHLLFSPINMHGGLVHPLCNMASIPSLPVFLVGQSKAIRTPRPGMPSHSVCQVIKCKGKYKYLYYHKSRDEDKGRASQI